MERKRGSRWMAKLLNTCRRWGGSHINLTGLLLSGGRAAGWRTGSFGAKAARKTLRYDFFRHSLFAPSNAPACTLARRFDGEGSLAAAQVWPRLVSLLFVCSVCQLARWERQMRMFRSIGCVNQVPIGFTVVATGRGLLFELSKLLLAALC